MLKTLKAKLRIRKLAANGIFTDVNLPLASYGDRSGVWTLYPNALGPGAVVYSFGVGDNIAWDLAMIENHQAEVHAFDPTPRSISWVSGQDLPGSFHFYPVGLGAVDGEIDFVVPAREGKINYSTYRRKKGSQETVPCEVKRFDTIVSELGHGYIDVVKMDIEGGEMDVLDDILDSSTGIGQILVEFHYMYPTISFSSFADKVASLRNHGYRLLHVTDRAYEFSFIHESLVDESTDL